MSGVPDKARFYLERSVPQLREWEEKELFTKDDIRTIVQKRNDFEHRILAPGNTPADFSTYASWEISLNSLVLKRCNRLRLRHLSSSHASQARILQIYDRGVERHQLARSLWLEYLSYACKVKASKRWRKTMTRMLRLMPNDGELWVIAARRSASTGDMASARSLFMRGCRFCAGEPTVWIEYARCEMNWLKKIWVKKQGKKNREVVVDQGQNEDEIVTFRDDEGDEDADENGMILAEEEAAVDKPKVFNQDNADKLKGSPAMDGAIPLAIFDISQKQAFFSPGVAESFFDMFADFRMMEVGLRSLQHVLDVMQEAFPGSAATCYCFIRQPVVGISPLTADFPRGLREVLARLKSSAGTTKDKARLREMINAWVDRTLVTKGLDPAIATVLEHMKTIVEP